jgi:hypothetical protein
MDSADNKLPGDASAPLTVKADMASQSANAMCGLSRYERPGDAKAPTSTPPTRPAEKGVNARSPSIC